MKYALTLSVLTFIALCCKACVTEKKAVCEFPAAMLSPVKTEYEKLCDKGQILYNLNCANCHNGKANGKTFIPDFTVEQLEAYKIRVLNAKHESELTEVNMTEEELGLIVTFFTYKKKNNLPIPAPKEHSTSMNK